MRRKVLARDNWEVRFVTCPIARMPYNSSERCKDFLGKCLREREINKKKVYPFAHCVEQ
jgi:hypothetical protein